MATLRKFSDDWATLNYYVFETFADGLTLWRALVVGMADTELKLLKLARRSNNKFFAICLQGRDQTVIRAAKETSL
jgi:hypothetical protein